LLASPKEWDVSSHPVLPLYAAYKTNSLDNRDMPPPQRQLIFTAPGTRRGIRQAVAVPKALGRGDGKMLKGDFAVDLRPYFVNSTGKLPAPKSLFVTLIRGDYIGEPHPIELPHPR
jgi:hypothetical protein